MLTHDRATMRSLALVLAILGSLLGVSRAQLMMDETVVLQTTKGDIELGFFADVAPVTTAHILDLFKRGAYDTNHFFRVDRGFVAQIADVVGGRRAPLDAYQRLTARDKVPGEFQMKVLHTRGILSMGRYDDPDSGTSSFSILLGNAPHLDGKYTVFGKVLQGDETLRAMEEMPTKREGMFVMPTERIEIQSTYVKNKQKDGHAGTGECEGRLEEAQHRIDGLLTELHKIRQTRLPG